MLTAHLVERGLHLCLLTFHLRKHSFVLTVLLCKESEKVVYFGNSGRRKIRLVGLDLRDTLSDWRNVLLTQPQAGTDCHRRNNEENGNILKLSVADNTFVLLLGEHHRNGYGVSVNINVLRFADVFIFTTLIFVERTVFLHSNAFTYRGHIAGTVGDKLSYISLLCFINQSTYGLRTFRIGGAVRELEIQIAHFIILFDGEIASLIEQRHNRCHAICRRVKIRCGSP